ncbi:MAG: serine--tRNA ligase [Verrucomicrobiota bacterium]
MLDIRLFRENADEVKARLASRGKGDEKMVDEVIALDAQRRQILSEVEKLKSERNSLNKEIGAKKSRGESVDEIMQGMKERSERVTVLDKEVAEVEEKQRAILLRIPNLPHKACPKGTGAQDNPVVKTWGEKPKFNFKPMDHVSLVEKLKIIDFDIATKISGSGFILYQGAGARLERALINFLLDLQTKEHGYTEISPPFIIREACMEGTSQLPKFKEDMYGVTECDLYLAPTAEVPVTNMHREEIVPLARLPIRYAAYTPCFRREAGSAGRETRGMIRVHQFDKVELVKIVEPSTSYDELESLRGNAEKVLELLGLHYRTIELCAGDIGFGAAKCYDLEVWAPGSEAYLEVSSCSNFEDFQARRMNLRYKAADGKNYFCHTLNGSGTALARLYIALVETYQQADGTIALPKILHPYFDGERIG